MISGGVPIGRLFGISLKLHWTWFFIFALVTWALVVGYYPSRYPNWTASMRLSAGLLTSVMFFGSVLIHELMHSIVAIRQGIKVHSITLFILGGVSQMTEEPQEPKHEFRMAAAGPLSSLMLGGIFWTIVYLLRGDFSPAAQFVSAISIWLSLINVMLGVFNLIPGFPLDGGRVFRSLIWWRSHNLQKATRIASNVGRAVGFGFIGVGVYLIFTGNWFNGIWFALIGWFLESAAVGSYRQLLLQDMLRGHVASEVMSRDCAMVPPDLTVDRLVNEHILASGRRCFPVASDGRIQGLVSIHNVKSVAREQWPTKQVKEIMTPVAKLKSISPNEDLNSVLQTLADNDINQVPVVQDNRIVGVVARDNIINFINLSTELGPAK